MSRLFAIVGAAFLILLAAGSAPADDFVLRSGGTISGELLNPDEEPRETYVVATATGGRIVLRKEQVVEVRRLSEAERLYEKWLPRMPKNADGNWKMAEWCRQNGLEDKRQLHLEQVLTYDPDHEQARYALGYSRVDGRWVIPDEWNTRQGYVKHKSSWRTKQEVELETRARERELAVKGWNMKIDRWVSDLASRSARRAEEARRQIAAIRDPLAAPGLGEQLEEVKFLEAKLMIIERLGELNCQASSDALLKCAMDDESRQVRDACWEELADDGSPAVVAELIKELQSSLNARVNRAAVGLANMKSPEAVLPLIDALETIHKYDIVKSGGNMSASFGSGGTGFSPGGKRIERREIKHQNREVLNALSILTNGVNFQFDKDRWRDWYARVNTPPNINLRRSE